MKALLQCPSTTCWSSRREDRQRRGRTSKAAAAQDQPLSNRQLVQQGRRGPAEAVFRNLSSVGQDQKSDRHEGLWVNCQPGLPLSTKNIASMEIGSQEYISRRGSRQLLHYAHSSPFTSSVSARKCLAPSSLRTRNRSSATGGRNPPCNPGLFRCGLPNPLKHACNDQHPESAFALNEEWSLADIVPTASRQNLRPLQVI